MLYIIYATTCNALCYKCKNLQRLSHGDVRESPSPQMPLRIKARHWLKKCLLLVVHHKSTLVLLLRLDRNAVSTAHAYACILKGIGKNKVIRSLPIETYTESERVPTSSTV